MGDFYRGDYFLESGVTIKQEISDANSYNTSASVPIPSKRIADYHDSTFDFESSQSSSFQDINVIGDLQTDDGGMMWGNRMALDMELSKNDALIHMDDDDIFQVVDKADLIQGPTLAELNANDETLLGDLNFDDLLLPEEGSYNYVNIPTTQKMSTQTVHINTAVNRLNNNHSLTPSSCPQTVGLGFYRDNLDLCSSPASTSPYNAFAQKNNTIAAFSPVSQNSSNSSIHMSPTTAAPSLLSTTLSPVQQKHSTLHELLLKKETNDSSPDRTMLGQSVPAANTSVLVGSSVMRVPRSHISRLSSSAPTHLGLEQIWQRREPRKHLHSTGSLAEAGSTSSLSTGGILSPDPQDLSHDEFDSDEDSEHYEDFSSDNADSDDDGDDHNSRGGSSPSKKERYFWQYNVQAKGPKGQRLVMKSKMEDPHILHEITDPVFSPDCSVRGIKHSGKARKGDGNDLTPNARKLYSIGKELDKLSRIINDMTPVSELPFNIRPKTRKEKNKLASRACRLKKKAQHEANKIKLHGLEGEHKRLLNGIQQAKQILVAKISEASTTENQEELTKHIDKVAKSAGKVKIAGHSTEYVNKVLDKFRNGGGTSVTSLDDL